MSDILTISSFFLFGVVISFLNEQRRIAGWPFMIIGLFEMIRYPNRERRWVKKKEKEAIFGKDLIFEILDDTLKITCDEVIKSHKFKNMRKCLISETGILFKISWSEYYYISFKSVEANKEEIINRLCIEFDDNNIEVKMNTR